MSDLLGTAPSGGIKPELEEVSPMEEMIDYIVNHKGNLNGNILLEMLEHKHSEHIDPEPKEPAEPAEPSGQIVV